MRVVVEDYHAASSAPPKLEDNPGTLELPWRSDDPSSPKLLASRKIPSRSDEKARIAQPEDLWAWENVEPVLPARVRATEDKPIVPGYKCRTSEIFVPLPDLTRTGEVWGTVKWGNSQLDLQKTPIRAGLVTVGKIGFVGESVGLVGIFSDKTPGIEAWPNELTVNITGPDGSVSAVALQRELPDPNGFVRYFGEIEPIRAGIYSTK